MTKGKKLIKLPSSQKSVGMTRNFSYALVYDTNLQKWSLRQQKIFFIVLSHIDWRKPGNSNEIEIDISEFQEKLQTDYSESHKCEFSKRIKNDLEQMTKNSFISLQDPFTEKWTADNLISHSSGDGYKINVELNKRFMPQFERLYESAKMNKVSFIVFSEYDIYLMSSLFGVKLFIDLNNCSNHNGSINTRFYTTKKLKDIFGLPKDAYCREYDYVNEEYTSFDRCNFEKRVLKPAVKGVNKSNAIKLLPYEDGKLYKKVKEGRRVKGYEFQYRVCNVASFKEITESNESEV